MAELSRGFSSPNSTLALPVGTSEERPKVFERFITRKFSPHLYTGRMFSGCGATALGLLMGVDPYKLPMPRGRDWTTGFMLRHLRANGFRVMRLTCRNLTNLDSVKRPIQPGHVILASIYFIKGMASWVVLHNGMMYHNFEVEHLRAYEFLNHPLREAYLVKRRGW